jgi:hypothetical protein
MTDLTIREADESTMIDEERIPQHFPASPLYPTDLDLEAEQETSKTKYTYQDKQSKKAKPYGIWQVIVSVPKANLLANIPEYILHASKMQSQVRYQIKADRLHFTFDLNAFSQKESLLQQIHQFFFDILEWEVFSSKPVNQEERNGIHQEYMTSVALVLNELSLEELKFYFDFRMYVPKEAEFDLDDDTSADLQNNLAMVQMFGGIRYLFLDKTRSSLQIGIDEGHHIHRESHSIPCRLVLLFSEEWNKKTGAQLLDVTSGLVFDRFQPLIATEIRQHMHWILPCISYMKGSGKLLQMLLYEEIPTAVRLRIIAKILLSGLWGSLLLTSSREKLKSFKDWALDVKM